MTYPVTYPVTYRADSYRADFGHAYPGKHRGEPRRCAACRTPETECADWHMFCDVPGAEIHADQVIPGRHRADVPTLEGP